MAVPPSLSVSVGVPPADRHRLAQVERQRHHVAGLEVAVRRDAGARRHHRRYRRRRGVDLQRAGWVGDRASDRLAALPAPSVTVAPLRLTAVTARSAVFWPAATV